MKNPKEVLYQQNDLTLTRHIVGSVAAVILERNGVSFPLSQGELKELLPHLSGFAASVFCVKEGQ